MVFPHTVNGARSALSRLDANYRCQLFLCFLHLFCVNRSLSVPIIQRADRTTTVRLRLCASLHLIAVPDRTGYSHTTALSPDGTLLIDVKSNASTPLAASIVNLNLPEVPPVLFFQQRGKIVIEARLIFAMLFAY